MSSKILHSAFSRTIYYSISLGPINGYVPTIPDDGEYHAKIFGYQNRKVYGRKIRRHLCLLKGAEEGGRKKNSWKSRFI